MQLLRTAARRRGETMTEIDFDGIIKRDNMYLDDNVERIRVDVRRALDSHPPGVNDRFSIANYLLLCPPGGTISQEKKDRQVVGVLCAHRVGAGQLQIPYRCATENDNRGVGKEHQEEVNTLSRL